MAKDIFHQAVRTALEKDGWTITHDPYPLRLLGVEGDIDLGAERVLGAERSVENTTEKIAVEPGRRSGEKFSKSVVHAGFS